MFGRKPDKSDFIEYLHAFEQHVLFSLRPHEPMLHCALDMANWKRVVHVAGPVFIIALLNLYLRCVKIADGRLLPSSLTQAWFYDVRAVATTRDVTQMHHPSLRRYLLEPTTKPTRCAGTSESEVRVASKFFIKNTLVPDAANRENWAEERDEFGLRQHGTVLFQKHGGTICGLMLQAMRTATSGSG